MDGVNKKYYVELEVLTPLSIGAGAEKNWVAGADYVVHNGYVYKLSLSKIVEAGIDMSRFAAYLVSKDERGIINLISPKRLETMSEVILKTPISKSSEIKSFVKNQLTGLPLITGSSLKGAIRSVVLDYLTQNESSSSIQDKLNNGNESCFFGTSKDGDEFMRFIKIADAEFDKTSLVNTKIFNLIGSGTEWSGGWKHDRQKTTNHFNNVGFNTLYEVVMPKQKGYTTIMTSLHNYDLYSEKAPHKYASPKRNLLYGGIKELFSIINNHTKAYLLKELNFFNKYNQAEHSESIIDSISQLLSMIPSDNSYCLLKMSAGSGYHSITGDWRYDDYTKTGISNGKHMYKSRKIATWGDDHYDLMGFVKISKLSDAEIRDKKIHKQRELEEYAKIVEEERVKRQVELEEKKKAYELRERMENEYAQYCDNLKVAYDRGNWQVVIECADDAERVYPGRQHEFTRYVDEAISNLKRIENQRKIDEARKQEEEERRLRNAVPLSEKIGNATKLPTLFGNVAQWMKQNSKEELTHDELNILHNKVVDIFDSLNKKDKSNFKGRLASWQKLIDIIGEDVVKEWVENL